jgi:hypothetical protein
MDNNSTMQPNSITQLKSIMQLNLRPTLGYSQLRVE